MVFLILTVLLASILAAALPQNPSPSMAPAVHFSMHLGPIGPILRPTSTIPDSPPTPTGNLLATIEYYYDDHCSEPMGSFQYYDGQEPRCQDLPGNSAIATYLFQQPNPNWPSEGLGPYSYGTGFVPFLDKLCVKEDGPAYGGPTNERFSFDQDVCVNTTILPMYEIMWWPTEI